MNDFPSLSLKLQTIRCLTALRHGRRKMTYERGRRKENRSQGGDKVGKENRSQGGRPHLAQFPRHWPAPVSGYWADLGKGETIVRSLVFQPLPALLLLLKLDRLHDTGFSSSSTHCALSHPLLPSLTNITQCAALSFICWPAHSLLHSVHELSDHFLFSLFSPRSAFHSTLLHSDRGERFKFLASF